MYGMPVIDAIRNAATPMIGGISVPPVEATASVAAAKSGLNPWRFIKGMVKIPVVVAFATGEPLIEPNSALAPTAASAGPARVRRVAWSASLMK